MQEVFSKIIEELEEKRLSCFLTIANTGDEKLDCAYKHVGDALDKSIEIVKQEAKKFGTDTNVGSNGWIPVSDHIPVPVKKSFGNKQKRTNVLVTLRNGLVKEMTFEFETNEFWEVGDDNHIEHWKEDAIDTDDEVVAWQPLPQPYQPKGE